MSHNYRAECTVLDPRSHVEAFDDDLFHIGMLLEQHIIFSKGVGKTQQE